MQAMTTGPSARPVPGWFLLLLAAYAVLELSFNHRLIQASAAADIDLATVHDLEFWARIVSGLGLAFWLMRFLLSRLRSALLVVLLSSALGVVTMWHVQRWMVDGIVQRASEADKRMSLLAQQLVPEAMAGQVLARGLPLVQPQRLSESSQTVWRAVLPVLTLGLEPKDLQLVHAQAPVPPPAMVGLDFGPAHASLLTDAYRRAVMVPIALGVSLLFGLANLCLLAVLLVQRLGRAGLAGPSVFRQRAWFALFWGGVLVWSWQAQAEDVAQAGYRDVAWPALLQGQPLLAPFVEWTLRAEPAWQAPTHWLHQHLMGGYGFARPPGTESIGL